MIAMQSRFASHVVFFLLLAVLMCQTGCGGSASQLDVASPVAAAEPGDNETSFAVAAADRPSLTQLGLEILEQPGQVVVQIHATEVQQLDGLFFELNYDPALYTPLAAQATDALAPPARSICLEVLSVPGTVHFGQVPLDGAECTVDAGAVLAEVLFACEAFPVETTRSVSQVPAHKGALSPLVWDGEAGELRWYYANPGDYNQDGLVALSDLASLGHDFGATGPFSYFTALSVIDGNGDGIINIADLTAIGQYWGNRVEGYNLYASNNVGNIPTGFSEPSTIMPLANFSLDGALGDAAADRLWFSYAVGDTGQYVYYWVRPYAGGSEGTRSNVNGPSLDMPPPIDPGGDGFNLAPVARLGLEYTGSHVPLAVTFDATQSSDPDGEIVFYEWDFEGDGLYDSFSTGAVALHTYLHAGTYTPLVRVTDNGGLWDSFQSPPFTLSEEEVSNIPPVADLVATAYSGEPLLTVGFIATGSTDVDGYIAQYEWDFVGDGSYDLDSGADPTVLHTYTEPGTYDASVCVTDNRGATATDAFQIEVLAPNQAPVAALSADVAYGDVPLTVNFDASSSTDPDGSIMRYWWDWEGDGIYDGFTMTETATYAYPAPGHYFATVMIEDNCGLIDTTNLLIVSNEVLMGPSAWWSFGHDQRHTSRSPFVGAQTSNVKWSYTTGNVVYSSPAIGTDGTVYVGSHDGKLHAINPDGSLTWSYTTGWNVESSPAIGADGTVYVGCQDNRLYAINPDGSLMWSYTTGFIFVKSSPAIGADGTVYVGSYDSKLYAINPDGNLKWSYSTVWYVHSSPAIGADGTVYVGSYYHKLYAINPDGSLKWSYPTGSIVRSSPAIGADGTVYVGSDDGKLYAISPDGSLKWSYSTGNVVYSSPAIGADGTVYVGSGYGKLCAINPDGSLKWSYTTGGDVASSPAIGADGTVYVGSDDGKLYAFGPGP